MCEHGSCVICTSRMQGEAEFDEPYPEILPDDYDPAVVPVDEEERMRIAEHLFRSETQTWSTVKALAVITAGRAVNDDDVEALAKSLRVRVVRPVLDGELVDEITLRIGTTLTGTRVPS